MKARTWGAVGEYVGICVLQTPWERYYPLPQHVIQVLVVPGSRMRGSRYKLNHRKFYLNMRKNFLTVMVIERRNRLPREVVDSPSLEILKSCIGTVLSNVVGETLLGQGGWARWPPVVPSSLNRSVSLWFYLDWFKSMMNSDCIIFM